MSSCPVKCPVCEGNGLVPAGFYDAPVGTPLTLSSTAPEKCRSCNGTGIIWSIGLGDFQSYHNGFSARSCANCGVGFLTNNPCPTQYCYTCSLKFQSNVQKTKG